MWGHVVGLGDGICFAFNGGLMQGLLGFEEILDGFWCKASIHALIIFHSV